MPSTPEQPHRPEDADERDRSDREQLRRPDEDETTDVFQRAADRVRKRYREALDKLAKR